MSQTTVKYRGVRFDSGDESFIVPPLSLGQVEEHEEAITEIGQPVDKANPMAIFKRMRCYVPVVHAALSRNYPSITLEQVKEFLDADNFQDVFAAVIGTSSSAKVKSLGESTPVTVQLTGDGSTQGS